MRAASGVTAVGRSSCRLETRSSATLADDVCYGRCSTPAASSSAASSSAGAEGMLNARKAGSSAIVLLVI